MYRILYLFLTVLCGVFALYLGTLYKETVIPASLALGFALLFFTLSTLKKKVIQVPNEYHSKLVNWVASIGLLLIALTECYKHPILLLVVMPYTLLFFIPVFMAGDNKEALS